MATPKNLQDYLKSLPEWKSASKEVSKAKAEVSKLQSALGSAPASSKADLNDRLKSAQNVLSTATTKLNKIQSDATSYYNANPEEFANKIKAEKETTAQTNLEEAIATRNRLAAIGQDTTLADKAIAKLRNKISAGFEESPKPGSIVDGNPPGVETKPEDFANMVKTARSYVKSTLDNAGRLALAQSLKDAGVDVPLTGEFTEALVTAYKSAITGAQNAYNANKEFPTVAGFLSDQIRQNNAIKAAGGGGGGTEVGINISSPTDAQALIQSTFKSVLGREATDAELNSFASKLKKAEQSAGRRASKVGNRTTYTSDLNREQFLTNEIKKIVDPKSGKSEFETKRAEKEGLTAQSLQAVAKLNGINLSQDQLDAYATDIRNGKDINVIKNNIRQMAGLGRPDSIKKLLAEGTDLDTIYSPYKTTMASLLEIPADQIDLNDATLQGAIGPDKELPLYEFRKALKKDSRWQYTDNAREEVASKVMRVLKDFGFQG